MRNACIKCKERPNMGHGIRLCNECWRQKYAPMPTRIQRRRERGWRMPATARAVTRPGIFGNPFVPAALTDEGRRQARDWFRDWLDGKLPAVQPERRARLLSRLNELRGRDLACYCPLPKPGEEDFCHACVLIDRANPRT